MRILMIMVLGLLGSAMNAGAVCITNELGRTCSVGDYMSQIRQAEIERQTLQAKFEQNLLTYEDYYQQLKELADRTNRMARGTKAKYEQLMTALQTGD